MGRHTLVDKSTVREEQPSGSAKILHLPSSKQLEERRLARINYFNFLYHLTYDNFNVFIRNFNAL